MSEPKFTPGPWSFDGRDVVGMVGEIDTCIAECFDHSSIDRHNAKANAYLIAAAPELYEALELLVSYGDVFAYRAGTENPYLKGKAALAKARGELMTPREKEND